MRTSPVIKATVFVGMAVLLVAGCASSKKSSSGSPTAASTAAAAAGGSGAAAGTATVSAQMGKLGDYLTDGSGKTLYMYTPDTSSTSTCYGQCITYWPADVTSGAPKAGAGADASKLGTSPRTDGTTQVTYNGHPLYHYVGDKGAGDISGQGTAGTWYVVSPAGTQIGGKAGASPSSAVKSGKY